MTQPDEEANERHMSLCRELWILELKLVAMSYLFQGHTEEASEHEGAFLGISYVLSEMSKKVAELKDELEDLMRR